jgi:hypothetical protein
MLYLRAAVALAVGQVTPMHCVCAVIALAIAITFPRMAYAQTNAIHVFIAPVGETTPATPVPTCTQASCQKLVPRYPKSPTYMLGILEYNTVTCMENTPGQWAGFPSTTKNNGEISTGFASGPPPPCPTSQKIWTYAVIYFNWTLHNNHSMPSPSLVVSFPMDQFPATWTDPNTFGYTQSCFCTGPYPYTFNPYVAVVRPIDETQDFKGFRAINGVYGRWMATLMPPDGSNGIPADPTFDFNGEVVKEELPGSNNCDSMAPGLPPPDQSTTPGVNGGAGPASWIVGQLSETRGTSMPGPKNAYGFDFVGWDKCPIEAYRCAKVTEPSCGTVLMQKMQIKSPADQVFADYIPPKTNILMATISGRIIPPPNPNKAGTGYIQSYRGNGGLHPPFAADSNIKFCTDWQIAKFKPLLHCGAP